MILRYTTILILIFWSCKSTQTITPDDSSAYPEETYDVLSLEGEEQDSVIVEYYHPIKDYRASDSRYFDLIHTKLELRFDWEKQYVLGTATLKLSPYFYPQELLVLDARSMLISSIMIADNTSMKALQYEYVNDQLFITLDRTYTRNEDIIIKIEYTARPNEITEEGNEAITSDKGLFFINPAGRNLYKPRQIWTQGETQANSAWFPTIDSPSEKTTQEIYLTVADTLTTLSNGVLVSSVENNDGTKTDYWKLDKPHAPYLAMVAVGNFTEVEDQWREMPLGYYVEPEFETSARAVFGNTPEMLTYFSDILDYPYPWPQYNQIVVRDFVSGAMENTTASVFMEELQITERELLDDNWDYIIAHELFHHWFGNLVTTESWSNLPLNESFADFSEALWISKKYGKDEGDYHAMLALNNYLEEAEDEVKDLIRFYYEDKEDMFDRHSYEKGGAVLRMLKTYLGEEAFFASLSHYLKKHAYKTVEIHDLRLAFEEVSGEDLNWFFNQWFLNSGHPILNIDRSYSGDTLILSVSQIQDLESEPLFKLPVYIDVYVNGSVDRYPVVLDSEEEDIKILAADRPQLVVFDAEQLLVGEVNFSKTTDELIYQLKNADNLVARYRAFVKLAESDQTSAMTTAILQALEDRSYRIISLALDYLQSAPEFMAERQILTTVRQLTAHEESVVRSGALFALTEYNPGAYREEILNALTDSSYGVQGVALEAVLKLDSLDKDEIFRPFIDEEQLDVLLPVANYVNTTADAEYFDWYQKRLSKFRSSRLFYFIQYYAEYIISMDDELKNRSVPLLKEIALHGDLAYTRYSAFQILYLLSDDIDLGSTLEEIKENEQDEELSVLYERL